MVWDLGSRCREIQGFHLTWFYQALEFRVQDFGFSPREPQTPRTARSTLGSAGTQPHGCPAIHAAGGGLPGEGLGFRVCLERCEALLRGPTLAGRLADVPAEPCAAHPAIVAIWYAGSHRYIYISKFLIM